MGDLAEKKAMTRINSLVDPGSFVEIGGMVCARNTDFNIKKYDAASDGVITGYGIINGCPAYIYSQDVSVLNGTVGEMHSRKICNLYDMALKTSAPVIGLLDCAGLRLQEATDALNAFGNIYAKQSEASGIIPQITGVFGNCGGGLSVIPALTDFTFMENDAKLFVNAPNTLDGNSVDKLNTASAEYHAKNTGIVDFTGSEMEILAGMRSLLSVLPANNTDDLSEHICTDDINRLCENMAGCLEDTSFALRVLSDSSQYIEIKKDYAPEMVTAFIKINGYTVGAVANRTKVYDEEMNVSMEFKPVLTSDGALKAADFVNFCDAFGIPVLSLTNVEGFKADIAEEVNMAKAVAKLTNAFASATVPKVNVITKNAFGSGYIAMNSKSLGADMTFAFADAKIGTMEPKEAVMIMYADEIKASEDSVKLINDLTKEYTDNHSSAIAAAKRGYVDAIIDSVDLRKHIVMAFEMLYSKEIEILAKKHGTV